MDIFKDRSFIISIIILPVILVFRDILGINVNQIMIFMTMAISVIVLPFRSALCYTAFSCGIIAGVNAYFLGVAFILLLVKSKRSISFVRLLPVILLLVLEFLNNILILGNVNFAQLLLYASYLSIFFYFLCLKGDSILYREITVSYILGLAITLLIISFSILQNPLIFQEGEELARGSMGVIDDDTSTHFALNANTLAYFSIALLVILFLGYNNLKINKYLFYILLLISVISGVLSQSRTWLILVCVIFVMLIFCLNIRGKFKLLFLSMVFSLTAIIFYKDFIYIIYDSFFSRFNELNIETAGGRTEIFRNYNVFMWSNPQYVLTGTGCLQYKQVAGIENSCHNAIQQIFVSYGLVGLLIFVISYVRSMKIGNTRTSFISYIIALTPILFIQSIQFLHPHYLMLPVAMCVIASRIPYQTKNNY